MVVEYLSSLEFTVAIFNLVMMFFKNMPQFARMFSPESVPASFEQLESQIDWTKYYF